ncbi:type-2 ice-structuring protein isoform X2 [Oryzias melastigma]|uniref:Type-2 ice-structuring protein-like n=1 Tax=Oryzias melastigma TaxID=30732 RepID=A0A3B3CV65_ORYME|nr:type-2 ice-structuring protein isoform X2 [Oryzias melastigma]
MQTFLGSRCFLSVHRRTTLCSEKQEKKTILWQMLAVLVVVGAVVSVVQADDALTLGNNSSEEDHPQPRALSSTEAWSDLDGRSFLFVKKNLTWIEAEKNCQSMKANLASVHSEKEYRFIQELVIATTGNSTLSWIGGSDCHQNNLWIWSDGTVFSFTMWSPRQPDNLNGIQSCIQINFGKTLNWDDTACFHFRTSICARNV